MGLIFNTHNPNIHELINPPTAFILLLLVFIIGIINTNPITEHIPNAFPKGC